MTSRDLGASAARPSISVDDVPERRRYEARTDDGALAGWIEYEQRAETVTLWHTIVPPAYEGRGVASALVARTLADLRSRGQRVIARCPFVVSWLRRHPDDQDVLAEELPPAGRA